MGPQSQSVLIIRAQLTEVFPSRLWSSDQDSSVSGQEVQLVEPGFGACLGIGWVQLLHILKKA